jgi:hypothetical protein
MRSTSPPVAHLGPETILTVATLGLYIAGALRTVRRLQNLSLPAARRSVLMLGGVGLLLASMLLRLR